jgi:hypothetical protein
MTRQELHQKDRIISPLIEQGRKRQILRLPLNLTSLL